MQNLVLEIQLQDIVMRYIGENPTTLEAPIHWQHILMNRI